jgi:hypothetical protein
MVKICQTGLLKLNFETRPKKRIFLFLPKISAGMDEVEIFFANFQILGPLGCQGWVVIPQNVKKVKITAPYWATINKQRIFNCHIAQLICRSDSPTAKKSQSIKVHLALSYRRKCKQITNNFLF